MPRPKLLVVDDEPAIATLIGRVAEGCGFEVVQVAEAAHCPQMVVDHRPAVICIDLSMPGMDGIELLRFLADRKVTAQLLIVSGFDAGVVRAALRLGEALGLNMAGIISKPIPIDGLRKKLAYLSPAA